MIPKPVAEEQTPVSGPAPPNANPPDPFPNKAVTWRSVLLGLILMPPNSYWVVQMEVIRYSAHPTTISLLFNVVFDLLVVTLLNQLIGMIQPRWALVQGELMVVWTMLSISSVVSGHDFGEVLVPMLSWPYRFATADNGWHHLFMGYLPKWLMVSDPKALQGYYQGGANLYTMHNLRVWTLPALAWCGFITTLLFTMLCINCILRKQWTERERLTYPIVQLPLEMTSGARDPLTRPQTPALFRNRLFWIGFVLAGGIDLINGLNVYFPWIPTILTPGFGQSFLDLSQYITGRPWNAIGWTPISWYPFMIGLGMLMPVDFLFSCWFFYIFWKLELVGTAAMGWDVVPRFPYQNDQAFGAYLAFCLSAVWLGRDYLKQVYCKVVGLPSDLDDSDEPLSYRWAVGGTLLGLLLLGLFSVAAGMTPWVAVAFFFIYFALSLAITRMRAELGSPIHDLHFTGPDWTLSEVIGTKNFGAHDLTVFSLFFWFNRAYRCHPMPHQLEGFKLAERTRSSYRKWFWMMLLAGAAGSLAAFWSMLHLMFAYGATAKSALTFGAEPYNRLVGWMNDPKGPSAPAAIAIVVGLGVALFLEAMRVRFPWWPFHPLGFAITASWEINLVWMPLCIAWAIKSVLLRYGGLQAFRRSLPFFFGLIIGQFTVGSIGNIIGIILQVPTYQFWQ